ATPNFLLACSGYPHHLPSFPTRRSSDLFVWRFNAVLVPCPAGQPNSLLGGQEAVRAGAVPVVPDDVAARIDATAERSDRAGDVRSEEHTSELQSRGHHVCRLLLEKKKHG